VPAVEEAEQVLGGHLAGEAEPLREAAEGAGRSRLRLAVVGDVVVPEIGVNLEEVVGDGAELPLSLAWLMVIFRGAEESCMSFWGSGSLNCALVGVLTEPGC